MSRQTLKKMISKFGKIAELGCCKEEDGNAFQMKPRKKSLLPRSKERPVPNSSARALPIDLSHSWFTGQKALRSIVKWYPYKIQAVQALNPADSDEHTQFARLFGQNNR
ncbi:hypothetical protein AVEN_56473-1 [Araneus ventricosus]|uniref:Uncharacterized protein n=1 Tax=Araneus ventricosus TaxID=182803 RepID=A0A4Y2PQT8_ARAVE|nr:hypothetical protein AVEN_56473-1 [Araneus ventricosus]